MRKRKDGDGEQGKNKKIMNKEKENTKICPKFNFAVEFWCSNKRTN